MAHLDHASKRRRLNEAASTLSRPFKSPLRRPIQKGEENGDEKAGSSAEGGKATNDQHDHYEGKRTSTKKGEESTASSITQRTDQTNDNNSKSQSQSQSPLALANRISNRKFQVPTQQTRPRSSSSYTASPSSKSDPVLYALQTQQTVLQSRLSILRSELDTAQQALRIETSNKDKELEALIAKWRAVSQEAADELFASARDKVMRMGGVAAWKEREKQRREMQRWYDADNSTAERWDDIDNSNSDDQAGSRKEMADEVGLNNVRPSAQRKQMKEVEEQEEEESFTMDMMLRGLNIELDIIGFDKLGQRWIKS